MSDLDLKASNIVETSPAESEEEWNRVSLPETILFYGGSSNWNNWRRSVGEKICLDDQAKKHLISLSSLNDFNLSGMDLRGYDFSGKTPKTMVGADFTGSLLNDAIFTRADLRKARFKQADLTGADFSETRLSGAVLDEETIFDHLKPAENVTVGINGIYVKRKKRGIDEESESAALMTLIPAGDSMKGHNSEAVLENLKHARQLNSASILSVTVVTVILAFPTIQEIQVPVIGLKLPVGWLSIIAQVISLVYQFLVLNHIKDAADGAKYLRTREDAMKIAMFPWGISNYPGKQPQLPRNVREPVKTFIAWWPWYSNKLNRLATSFHPLLFLFGGFVYLVRHWEKYSQFSLISQPFMHSVTLCLKPVLFILCSLPLLLFSCLVYRESRRFLRPIVFDADAEKATTNEMTSLAKSIEEQLRVTKRLASLVETAIPRYPNLVDRFYDRLPGGVEIPMRLIPAGVFQMGSEEDETEKPIHKVVLREFWMSDYPVTQQLWVAVMGRLPEKLKDRNFINPRYPVIFVSWNDAAAFCRKLNDLLALTDEFGYRLPSEAEWEYAARAGNAGLYCFGSDSWKLSHYAWFKENSYKDVTSIDKNSITVKKSGLQLVAEKMPNKFGLYDVHGNVWEWCLDNWHDSYKGAPKDGTAWEEEDLTLNRVLRGGGWKSCKQLCRSSYRNCNASGEGGHDLGFRLSRTLPSALLPSVATQKAESGENEGRA